MKPLASMTTNELYTELMALGIVGESERLRDINRELDRRRRAADPGETCPHHPPASTLANVACRTCGAFKVKLDTARVPESLRLLAFELLVDIASRDPDPSGSFVAIPLTLHNAILSLVSTAVQATSTTQATPTNVDEGGPDEGGPAREPDDVEEHRFRS